MESCKLKKVLMEKNSFKKPALRNRDGEEKKMMKKSSSGDGEDDLMDIKEVPLLAMTGKLSAETDNSNFDSSSIQQNQEEDQIESTKVKVGEVREENERLKQLLAQMLKDYQSLRGRFFNTLQQVDSKKTSTTNQEIEEPEIICLSLGRTSSTEMKKEEKKNMNGRKEDEKSKNEGLALGLECKFEPAAVKNPSPESSFGEEAMEMLPPNKILKTERLSGDEAVLYQAQLKKTRVSVRARCDTPTLNDGCQWRKYGQKIAKGNPCPRAYYRCTVSPTCPVRKQVQRCVEDMSILVTTYEGTHDHPLPLSATAMASTTSAAASMLQSQSSTSQPGLGTSFSIPLATSSASNLHYPALNFSQNLRPYQYYVTNPSISTSNSHPTITLDLTAPANPSYFNKLSTAPRYSPACFNFSSSSSSTLELNASQRNSTFGLMNLEKQPTSQEQLYRPHTQMIINQTQSQQPLPETIAAATKAIASNPNFRSALAAAITTVVANGGMSAQGDSSGMNKKWGDSLPLSTQNGVVCGSSFLSQSSLANSPQQQQQERSLPLFPINSLSLAASKSASGSVDNGNHIK
ncbi:hypothetical protein SLE2022_335240 [Rubroshorea leprosula]